MEFYTAKVQQYFRWEYSDFTLEEILEKLPAGNGVDEKKVVEIYRSAFQCWSPPPASSRKDRQRSKSEAEDAFR